MKITVYPINAKLRMQLVKDGWISRPPMTFINDTVSLTDFLTEAVKTAEKDPNFNVRSLIHTVFGGCKRYYLTDNFRRLFGLQREADNAFEMDITELFETTLVSQIERCDADVNHLITTLTDAIEKTEEYQAATLQLNVWGY